MPSTRSFRNIQASWVKLGAEGVRHCLSAGVNDLGGTLMDESISRSAGASHGQEMTPQGMERIIVSTGRVPRQRTTVYGDAEAEPSATFVRFRRGEKSGSAEQEAWIWRSILAQKPAARHPIFLMLVSLKAWVMEMSVSCMNPEIVDSKLRARAIARVRELGVVLPTFSQLADPASIPAAVWDRLAHVAPDEPRIENLWRVNWYNARRSQEPGGVAGLSS